MIVERLQVWRCKNCPAIVRASGKPKMACTCGSNDFREVVRG